MAKILLAEDDHAMRTWLAKALTNAGHDVSDFSNGADAFTQLNSNPDYDLLLTDIVMPGMDGIELAKKTQTLLPHIKTMFITGFAGMNLGNTPETTHSITMAKPFHLSELVSQVNALLDSK